jgi:Tol biopolymer transport system component
MKYVDVRDLPPCSYSPECLRLIDDLDVPPVPRAPMRLSYIDDLQDQRRLRQLRSHVPGCATCSALLAETRRTRTQQRLLLHRFLIANEQSVPSTTGAIFAAIRREQALSEVPSSEDGYAPLTDAAFFPPFAEPEETPVPELAGRTARPQHYRRLFQNVLTVATLAAVILAAVGLLNRFTSQSGTQKSSDQLPQQPNPAASSGWDSVMIGLTLFSAAGFTVYNFNAASGQMTTLFTSAQEGQTVNLETVATDGQTLLYDVVTPDQQKLYETFSPTTSAHQFYRLTARQGGNAVWMDASHVLVQTTQGAVMELDTRSGQLLGQWSVAADHLTFYHQPFLYFTAAGQPQIETLYRINLSQAGALPQTVAQSTPGTRFWLSPDGTTILYASTGSTVAQGIYQVHSDGTHAQLLRSGPGTPLGYTTDGTVLVMQQAGANVEVIKLGATPEEKEQVVLANAAPDATSLCSASEVGLIIALCNQNISLEPDGKGLVLHTYYADGSQDVVYDNLATGTSQKILPVARQSSVQLPGWSNIAARSTTAQASYALCA